MSKIHKLQLYSPSVQDDQTAFSCFCIVSFIPTFNIRTHLAVCFTRLRIISPYAATKGTYTLLFTRSLPLITFIPIKLLRTESGRVQYLLYAPGPACICTRASVCMCVHSVSQDGHSEWSIPRHLYPRLYFCRLSL